MLTFDGFQPFSMSHMGRREGKIGSVLYVWETRRRRLGRSIFWYFRILIYSKHEEEALSMAHGSVPVFKPWELSTCKKENMTVEGGFGLHLCYNMLKGEKKKKGGGSWHLHRILLSHSKAPPFEFRTALRARAFHSFRFSVLSNVFGLEKLEIHYYYMSVPIS